MGLPPTVPVIAVTGSMPVADVVAEIVPLPSKGKPPFIGVALEVRAQSKVTVAALPDATVMTSGKSHQSSEQ
jgi:hypothetical protein